MDRMGGLVRRMPKTAFMWLILAGSIAGVPLLSGFASKWLIYNAALESSQVVPALVAWFGSMLTVFSFLKATTAVFLGDENPENDKAREAPWPMMAGIGVLAAGSILLGVAPQLGINYLINPILPALGFEPVIGVSWFGMTTSSTSWFATGGLVLAMVSIVTGLIIYWLLGSTRRITYAATSTVTVGGGGFTGGAPLTGSARVPAHDYSYMVRQSLAPFYKWVDMDKYYLGLWHWLLDIGKGLQAASMELEHRAAWLVVVTASALAGFGLIWPISVPSIVIFTDSGCNWPLIAGTAVALVALVVLAASVPAVKRFVPIMFLAGALAVGGLLISEPVYRVLALEAASLGAVALVWQVSEKPRARLGYLVAVLLSAAAIISGTFLLQGSDLTMASTLLVAGFAVKLAIVPAYLWLPSVAESVPAPVAGLIIAVVDVAAFGEVIAIGQSDPLVFSQPGLWIGLALLSAIGGAVLMLGQHDIKRLLAFSTIQDMGYLLLGVVIGGELGLAGAIIGATVHAVAKAALFCSVAVVEGHEPVTMESRGLASRHPLAGVAFVAGALTVIGVPPTMGYLGHWRLFAAAGEANPIYLMILLVATSVTVLTYARVIGIVWWGGGDTEKQPVRVWQAITLIGLPLIMLAGGLWPGLFGA